jgi:hypothetical protein
MVQAIVSVTAIKMIGIIFSSVSMIMGNGPIKMMPAPFVLGFVFVTAMAIDKKMSTKPTRTREAQSDICARQVKHKKVEIIKV